MSNPVDAIRHWLTPAQILLLRAALLCDDRAAAAWGDWRATADLDRLDADSDRLLPLAWKNLSALGVVDPWFNRLKGTYRFHWARNQLLQAEALRVVQLLDGAGMPVMLLKGLAAMIHYYRDPGLRPACDFDIMVPLERAEAAADMLIRAGWRLNEVDHGSFATLRHCSHAAFFINDRGAALDLHWFLMLDDRHPGADDDVWRFARDSELLGRRVRIPSATDLLIHICAHGAWGPGSPIRWVADSVRLLRAEAGEVDWPRLTAQVRDRWLSLPLLATLTFLRDEFDLPVPHEVTHALAQGPHRWLERMELRQRTRPIRVFGALPFHCSSFLRSTRHLGFWQKCHAAPGYCRQVWNLGSTAAIPGYVSRRVLFRLRLMLTGKLNQPPGIAVERLAERQIQ